MADRWQKVAVLVALVGVMTAAFALVLSPSFHSWADANPLTLDSFGSLVLIALMLGLLAGLTVGTVDHVQAARLKHARLREEIAETRARRVAIEHERELVAAARAASLRAWDSVGPYFPFRAAEMPPASPEIWFMLPARSDAFDPRFSFLIVPTCGKCEDHPALTHSLTREGIGNGLCCQRCGTIYSKEIPGRVTNDAGNALVRRLTNTLTG